MQNVVLIIHLILAVSLIAVVLLQRSEGGALGIGGGGGGMSTRPPATAITKVTWALAVAFICTSILLTVISGGGTDSGSVLDQFIEEGDGQIPLPAVPGPADDGGGLLPPATSPQTPPAAE